MGYYVRVTRRRLPLGIQNFGKIRQTDSYYVDKTAWIWRLVVEGTHYFLSRPRRFGKSLLLDTMKELFEGNEPLFRGLTVHDRWVWSVRHPVVRLSFGSGTFREPGQVAASVSEQFAEIERAHGIDTDYETVAGRFRSLLRQLHERTGHRVAVLIDEYDKPILDPLFAVPPDEEGAFATRDVARANRDLLRGVYAVIKDADAHIQFSFLTGVSKFSKVSLFSGLNNLKDITLDRRYAAICGYTEADLDSVFAAELPGLDRARIREWYNGYNWRGEERMYNPFAVLMLFDTREFDAHWFETGSPRFLVESLVRRRVASPRLDDMVSSASLLSAFDVDHISTEALLFQTGYLTIREETTLGNRVRYRLGYPNLEVRQSLNEHLLQLLDPDPAHVETNQVRLHELLEAHDVAGLERLFHAFFSGIPHQWFTRNDIANYEGYYASVFYSYFTALVAQVAVEDSTSRGRLDMTVLYHGHIFLLEFKVIEQSGSGTALAQLQQRGYADKYRARSEPIHLIGIDFSSRTRNIERFEAETA